MGLRAIHDHDLDPSLCWMIGDKDSDIGFGKNLRMNTLKVSPEFTLADAVDTILEGKDSR